jgi:hypothetical protein
VGEPGTCLPTFIVTCWSSFLQTIAYTRIIRIPSIRQPLFGFDLPANSKVTLRVYDVIGREVATLVDNQEYEPGVQEIILNAGGFTSGVYFYRISIQSTVKSYTDVKKMMLLK